MSTLAAMAAVLLAAAPGEDCPAMPPRGCCMPGRDRCLWAGGKTVECPTCPAHEKDATKSCLCPEVPAPTPAPPTPVPPTFPPEPGQCPKVWRDCDGAAVCCKRSLEQRCPWKDGTSVPCCACPASAAGGSCLCPPFVDSPTPPPAPACAEDTPCPSAGERCIDGACRALTNVTVINDCAEEAVWVGNTGSGDAFLCPQMQKLAPGGSVEFLIPPEGMASMRWWPLAGCDDDTGLCEYGQAKSNSSGFPALSGPWNARGNMPDVNTVFEMTAGCLYEDPARPGQADPKRCDPNPSDTGGGVLKFNEDNYDLSAVSGVGAIPVSATLVGGKSGCWYTDSGWPKPNPTTLTTETYMNESWVEENCAKFDYFRASDGKSFRLDLRVRNMHGQVLGCASPCTYLTATGRDGWLAEAPDGLKVPMEDGSMDAGYYCCRMPGKAGGPSVNMPPGRCNSGFKRDGDPYKPFDVVYYQTQADQHVYSEPYSDDAKSSTHATQVDFTCRAGKTYEVRFGCPLRKMTAPPSGPSPQNVTNNTWMGPQYAKLLYRDVKGATCNFPGGPMSPEQQEVCGTSTCGDCSKHAVTGSDTVNGTSICLCAAQAPMAKAAPHTVPRWQDPTACPVGPPVATPRQLSVRAHHAGTVTAPRGTITDGWGVYEANTDGWVAVRGRGCRIEFREMDIEGFWWWPWTVWGACRYDWLEILSLDGGVLGRHCGSALPPPYTMSTGDGFRVRFRTDGNVQRKGFTLDFSCNSPQA